MNFHPSILEPFKISNTAVRNRAVVAPMTRVSTNGDGIPTRNMAEYYARYADGGFGLIIAEGTYTDRNFAQGYPKQPGITNDPQQQGWQRVVEAVHESEGKIFLQLMHAGSMNQHLSNTRSASAIRPLRTMLGGYSKVQGRFPEPQAANLAEIDQIIEGFVTSALRAEKAGFDGVEIHSANGYLLDQFITDYTNRREDQYGGSVENRCRLTADIIAQTKQVVSSNFTVGVRASQPKVNDANYRWPGGRNDAEIIFPLLKKAGTDFIHMASEGKGFDHGCYTHDGESLPQLAKELTGLPIIANGGMHNLQMANKVFEEDHADLIALGLGALANPDWVKRVANNDTIADFNGEMFAGGVTVEDQFRWEQSKG